MPNPFGRPVAENDMTDPFVQRERLFAQDPKILGAVRDLATRILSLRADPEFAERKPQALVVGGFVRDALLGKRPNDADVEVYGVSSERLERFLDEMFPGKLNKVGKTFGIFSVSLGDGVELDISLPRRESKVGEGHKGFEVDGDPTMSVAEAARRRDFSFNGLAADILSGEVIDPYGGIEDLKTKTLRVTDPERFQDDALRIYRGLQFAARMDLAAHPETLRLMREMVERGELTVLIDSKKTKELSKTPVGKQLLESGDLVPIAKGTVQRGLTSPRITDELKKLMLKAPRPSIGLDLARDLGILERYYPEFAGVESRRIADSVDGAARLIRGLPWLKDLSDKERDEAKMQIMFGSLAAEFSLPGTETADRPADVRRLAEGFFQRHEFNLDKIAKPATSVAAESREPQRILSEFSAGKLDEKRRDNELRKLLRRIYPTRPEVLAAVSQVAEQGSAATAAEAFAEGEMLVDCARRHPEWLLAPNQLKLVSGDELMALGFKGRALGQMQARIEQLRDEGIIETHEQAIEFLKNQAA
jgi:tRNA nucleotidyltransferase (CCA-adding enzyme)